MKNPFKQYLPPADPPEEAIESEVMNSIRLKSYMFAMLEFFLGILGFAAAESMPTHIEKTGDSTEC